MTEIEKRTQLHEACAKFKAAEDLVRWADNEALREAIGVEAYDQAHKLLALLRNRAFAALRKFEKSVAEPTQPPPGKNSSGSRLRLTD